MESRISQKATRKNAIIVSGWANSTTSGKIITHGATGDLINKHYRDVMRIIDDMHGKYLYLDLEKSYSEILLQIKNRLQ